MSRASYADLGLKVGLEIHIQLNTGKKLFCPCPTHASDESRQTTFQRYL
ncbi:MAG: hypothetical protein QW229_05595, partial [Desulfurococcaceae archaeon]